MENWNQKNGFSPPSPSFILLIQCLENRVENKGSDEDNKKDDILFMSSQDQGRLFLLPQLKSELLHRQDSGKANNSKCIQIPVLSLTDLNIQGRLLGCTLLSWTLIMSVKTYSKDIFKHLLCSLHPCLPAFVTVAKISTITIEIQCLLFLWGLNLSAPMSEIWTALSCKLK